MATEAALVRGVRQTPSLVRAGGQHGVLGRLSVYDGAQDPVVAHALELPRGRTCAQHQHVSDSTDRSVGHQWHGEAEPGISCP